MGKQIQALHKMVAELKSDVDDYVGKIKLYAGSAQNCMGMIDEGIGFAMREATDRMKKLGLTDKKTKISALDDSKGSIAAIIKDVHSLIPKAQQECKRFHGVHPFGENLVKRCDSTLATVKAVRQNKILKVATGGKTKTDFSVFPDLEKFITDLQSDLKDAIKHFEDVWEPDGAIIKDTKKLGTGTTYGELMSMNMKVRMEIEAGEKASDVGQTRLGKIRIAKLDAAVKRLQQVAKDIDKQFGSQAP